MDITSFFGLFILGVFALGYVAIILEHYWKVNKSAVAILLAVLCWVIYLKGSILSLAQDLISLSHHVSEVSQIIFFLMGAMALVELVDSHRGFKLVTDLIQTSSKRKLLWIVTAITFFLSSVLDNLTTTILLISLLRKLVPTAKERALLSCMVVIAANAGGAWTPIGDVTTTMLWINGQLSSFAVINKLFIPSLVSVLVPLLWFSKGLKGNYSVAKPSKADAEQEPGAKLVFFLGIGGLVFVPIFKALTGLPPFMGVILALGALWLVTDLMHHKFEKREHLRVPHVLTRIDTSGVLFFLGILLAVDALQTAGFLKELAIFFSEHLQSLPLIATLIGVISAVVDNVPLVAATMGMYPLDQYPMDHTIWMMIAYAAGTGGSMLIIGSSSGVAMMGLEKMDFITYRKKSTLPVFVGFLLGMGAYLLLN